MEYLCALDAKIVADCKLMLETHKDDVKLQLLELNDLYKETCEPVSQAIVKMKNNLTDVNVKASTFEWTLNDSKLKSLKVRWETYHAMEEASLLLYCELHASLNHVLLF